MLKKKWKFNISRWKKLKTAGECRLLKKLVSSTPQDYHPSAGLFMLQQEQQLTLNSLRINTELSEVMITRKCFRLWFQIMVIQLLSECEIILIITVSIDACSPQSSRPSPLKLMTKMPPCRTIKWVDSSFYGVLPSISLELYYAHIASLLHQYCRDAFHHCDGIWMLSLSFWFKMQMENQHSFA